MATLSTLGQFMLSLDPGIRPYSEAELIANRIQSGRVNNQTALLQLEDLRRQQATAAQVRAYYQQHPEELVGGGMTLGTLPTPGGPPGAITQSPMPGMPGQAQTIPAYPAASRYAGVAPQGGGPLPPDVARQGMPQVTPPGGMPTLGTLGQAQASMSPQDRLMALARTNPDAAMLLQQRLQAQQDRAWKLQEQQLDIGVKVAEAVARELQGVTDQASLDEARERIRMMHPQAAAQMPQFYSKEAIEAVQQRGIAVAEKAKWDLDRAKARQTTMFTEAFPTLMQQLGEFGSGGSRPAPAETTTPAVQAPGTAGNLGQRHNNPYNIKYGPATKHWVDEGLATVGEKAQDGGQFMKFQDAQVGERAGRELLQGPGYRDLTVDAALKRWSNNGYGAEIVKDVPADTKVSALTPAQRDSVMDAMRQREGWTAAPSGGTRTAQAPASDPRLAQLETEMRKGNALALQFEAMGQEGVARQIRSQVDDLQKQRDRLDAPRQEFLKKQAVQDLELQQKREEGLAAAQVKADTDPATKEEIDAINRQLPPDKRIPYSTTRKTIRERGLVGADAVAPKIIEDLTSTTMAIQNFEELSNAVTALPTGPLTQYVEGFKERWGIDISNEKVAQRAILQGATNQLLQARSGAAISEGEYQRLLRELPNEGLDPHVFKARLANTVRQFKNLYKTKVQILRKTGHAIPDDLMEPLASPEGPPTPKVSSNVDKFKAIKP